MQVYLRLNNLIFILILILSPAICLSQKISRIETTDITNFWAAYDKLPGAQSKEDSIAIIQQGYIDKATPYFRQFLRVRKFTAKEYVQLITASPQFWKSIRPLTERIASREKEIQEVVDRLAVHLPGFKRPDVCFAIGCLRTGGTTTKNLILVGAEIAAADSSVIKDELKAWQKRVVGQTGDIPSMVAHETVHTQQSGFPLPEIFSLIKNKKLRLLNMVIIEGSADFITNEFLGLNINPVVHQYGERHDCDLWKEFNEAIRTTPFDFSKWLYNGLSSTERPADLGYYMGYKITEGFYARASNKKRALKTILKRGKYKKIYKYSGYKGKSCD